MSDASDVYCWGQQSEGADTLADATTVISCVLRFVSQQVDVKYLGSVKY